MALHVQKTHLDLRASRKHLQWCCHALTHYYILRAKENCMVYMKQVHAALAL